MRWTAVFAAVVGVGAASVALLGGGGRPAPGGASAGAWTATGNELGAVPLFEKNIETGGCAFWTAPGGTGAGRLPVVETVLPFPAVMVGAGEAGRVGRASNRIGRHGTAVARPRIRSPDPAAA